MSQLQTTIKLNKWFRFLALLMLTALVFETGYSQVSQKDSLIYRLKRLQSTDRFNPKDTTHIKLLTNVAFSYRFANNDSLYSIANRVLDYCKAIDFKRGEVRALYALGSYYSDVGDRKKSMDTFKRGLELAKDMNTKKCELDIMNALGQNYSYEGNYAEALDIYLQGIDVAKQMQNDEMLSILNENIAGLYADQKDFKNALIFYDTVQKINRKLNDERIFAETQSNMASLYKDAKNFEHAMFNINKSISTFEKLKIYEWLAYAYEVKGSIYLEQKKYKWALYWYDQSSMVHEQRLDDDREKIQLFNGMSKVYLGLGQDELAMKYASQGLELSKRIQSLQGQMDCSETLYKVFKNQNDHVSSLSHMETFKTLSDSLSRDKNRQSLSLLETKLQHELEKQELIEANKMALAKQRNYIYFAVLILIILSIIIFVVRRSENIQKKLNKELHEKSQAISEREAQLNEINRTKTKLFSIIGHDLRGPIGALQSMLKLFTEGDISKEEFLSFIPKLKADVENIAFTLNNLLSWGQSQLNGVVTKAKNVQLDKLVDNSVGLLSEIAASKSIKIINQLPDNPLIWADQNQIDIVIRNLLSNAIKFTPKNGLITIEAEEKSDMWKIMIRDTGVGMNEEMQQKIFEDTNVTTYGTNNERGTGLGLSLCKEMVIKNKGEIWVESVPRKGSSFYFTVPKGEKKYKRAS